MIILKLNFIKTNPSGNTTILVDSAVPEKEQSVVAKRLLAYDSVQAEQVGFLTIPDDTTDYNIALRMMGGEFCGNATRSAAVYTVFSGLLRPNEGGSIYQRSVVPVPPIPFPAPSRKQITKRRTGQKRKCRVLNR